MNVFALGPYLTIRAFSFGTLGLNEWLNLHFFSSCPLLLPLPPELNPAVALLPHKANLKLHVNFTFAVNMLLSSLISPKCLCWFWLSFKNTQKDHSLKLRKSPVAHIPMSRLPLFNFITNKTNYFPSETVTTQKQTWDGMQSCTFLPDLISLLPREHLSRQHSALLV